MNTRSIRFRLTVWYAGLLAGMLVLFGASVYIGLGHYLKLTLTDSLTKEARQIGETLLVNVNLSGEAYVVDEIKEHLAPGLNGLFVRVTRADGSTLYESGLPKDELRPRGRERGARRSDPGFLARRALTGGRRPDNLRSSLHFA